MRILRAEIWACEDCTIWLCNADDSGMDEGRALVVRNACAEQPANLVPNFGGDDAGELGVQECPSDACEICGFDEPRYLNRFAELGEGPEELDHDGAREFPVANPSDHDATFRTQLFLMWAGGYSSRRVYVWADHFEDAFEVLVEWLDDNAPGWLSKSSEILADMDPEDRAKAEETGEIPDYTTIGHTTLKNGDCIASWEWGGNEVSYERTVEAVRLLCC